MFARVQRAITIAVLAGYLLMVTVAPPVHRCCSDHARSSAAPASEACTHCHWLRAELSGRTLEAGIAPSLAIAADAESDHHEADCLICQMLAQKYVANHGAGHAIWIEAAREVTAAEPCTAATVLLFPWHIRAPPSVA